jgi:hypothetical protein
MKMFINFSLNKENIWYVLKLEEMVIKWLRLHLKLIIIDNLLLEIIMVIKLFIRSRIYNKMEWLLVSMDKVASIYIN